MQRNTPSDPSHTGTLPTSGAAAVPVTGTASPDAAGRPAWLDAERAALTFPGRYLAYEDPPNGPRVLPVSRDWTRIGRSLAADVRFDDATVSRRHALVIVGPDGVRVTDDRSLNGVYVNGRRVEWSPLSDGDQIAVGRHRLFYIDTATVGRPVAAEPEPEPEPALAE